MKQKGFFLYFSIIFWSCLYLTACSGGISASQAEENADEALAAFFDACVNTQASDSLVSAWANQKGWSKLSEQEISELPFGLLEIGAHQVWRLPMGGHTFLYLHAEQGVCSLLASHVDVVRLQNAFNSAALNPPMPFEGNLRADHFTAAPFPFRQQIYAWWEKGATEEILLTANTSPSDYLPAQAALIYNPQAIETKVFDNMND